MTVAIFALFVAMGVSSTLFGLVLPEVTGALGISLAYAGLVTTLFSLGRTGGSLLSGFSNDRWGGPRVTWLSVLVMLGGLVMLSTASNVPFFFASSALMGLGFGALDVTLNAAISTLHTDRRAAMLSLLHGFYGVGSFMGPLVLGFVLAGGSSWRAAPWTVVLLFVISGALYVARVRYEGELTPPNPGQSGTSGQEHRSRKTASFLTLLRQPSFLLILPVGFIYQGISWSLTLWLPTFMTQVHGASPLQAASSVSALFVGITVGRFANSVLTQRVTDGTTLLIGTAGAFVSLTLSLLAPTQTLALVGLGFTGLSLSSLIPTSIAVLTRLTPDSAGTVSGAFMTLSATGVLVFPWLLGVLSERWGMRAGLGAGIVALVILLIDVVILRRLLARQKDLTVPV